jgi:nitrogen fixation protein FixH
MKALKNNIIIIMLVLFLALVIGTGYRVYTAFETHPGLIVENPYESGQKYASFLVNDRKVGESNWKISINTLGELTSNSEIKFIVTSTNENNNIEPVDFKILIFRPLEKKHDFEKVMKVSKDETNIFESTIKFPLKGVWDVIVEGTQGELIHRVSKRLFLKE